VEATSSAATVEIPSAADSLVGSEEAAGEAEEERAESRTTSHPVPRRCTSTLPDNPQGHSRETCASPAES
jgi:hypothetical protein